MDTILPIVLGVWGIIYLYFMVRAWMYMWHKGDPNIRAWIGERFGVTINRNFRGIWEISEPNQGARGCLIEMLQPLFIIPFVMLPLVVFVVVLMLLLELLVP